MNALPKSCVIGAGSSGLTAIKALKERGLPFDCFEMSDNIGGNWYFGNPNQKSSAYRLLHIDTSKTRMAFSDFPMPDDIPNFAHHSQVFQYFNDYCDHFGLRDHITFNTAVEKAERDGDGLWQVTLSTGETRAYDALFVCNGHHWDPRWPEPPFPGEFSGEQSHTHYYRDAEEYRDKRVVVLGMGNSAMDIAVELSYVAKAVYLAHRRGAYIMPKYLFGRPIDQWAVPGVPYWMARPFLSLLLRLQVGKMEQYGLKKPDHKLFEAHPSVSSTILDRIAHREIVPKPNIDSFHGSTVRFEDGSEVEADAVLYATGYKVTFPFFDEGFIAAPDNQLPLYLRMFKPDMPNLFFIGLYQPLGAIFPIAERQACIAGDYLLGKYLPPARTEMEATIARDQEALAKRYVRSKRHTMQVDFDHFMAQLKKEWGTGAGRAASAGGALPVAPRAADAAPTEALAGK